jgi:hypothetical protein
MEAVNFAKQCYPTDGDSEFFRNVDTLKMEAVCIFEIAASYRLRQYSHPKRQYPESGSSIFLSNDGIIEMETVCSSEKFLRNVGTLKTEAVYTSETLVSNRYLL